MKTKEFMAKVRSLEFGIIQEGHQLVVRTPECSIFGVDITKTDQTIFTESEIAQMDITGFEKVEVME